MDDLPLPRQRSQRQILADAREAFGSALRETFDTLCPANRASFRLESILPLLQVQGPGWHPAHGSWYSLRGTAAAPVVLRRAGRNDDTHQVCVPRELLLDVLVYEHVRHHAYWRTPDGTERQIAARYKGLTRDHLRLVRHHCSSCKHLETTTARSDPFLPRSAARTLVSAADGPAAACIVWVNLDRQAKSRTLLPTQSVTLDQPTISGGSNIAPCFQSEVAQSIMRDVGTRFVDMSSNRTSLHQSLVTSSILADLALIDLVCWRKEKLKECSSSVPHALSDGSLLLLHWSQAMQLDEDVDRIYRWYDETLPDLYGIHIQCYPSRSELHYAASKLADIRALDDIASGAPAHWAFRPTTCDSLGQCQLRQPSVLKRTNSCGSQHVILCPDEALLSRHLACRRRVAAHPSAPRWYHQQYIDGLRTAEYRVIIATTHDPTALRHRRGQVIEIIRTVEAQNKDLVVDVLTSFLYQQKACNDVQSDQDVNLRNVEAFALYIFEELRRRPDSLKSYASLEIGVRLDIGIHTASGTALPFVNEVTRIFVADFFCNWLAAPGLHPCKAVAVAMNDVLLSDRL